MIVKKFMNWLFLNFQTFKYTSVQLYDRAIESSDVGSSWLVIILFIGDELYLLNPTVDAVKFLISKVSINKMNDMKIKT